MQYNTLSAAVLDEARVSEAVVISSDSLHAVRFTQSAESLLQSWCLLCLLLASVLLCNWGRPLRTLERCNGSWRRQEDGTLLGFSATSVHSHLTMSFATSVSALQWHFSGTSVSFGDASRWVSSRERSCRAANQWVEQATSQPQGEHMQSNWKGNPTDRKYRLLRNLY